jgi:hypothetical protein
MLKEFFQKYTNLFGSIAMIATTITGWLATQGCIPTTEVITSTCTITWLPASLMPIMTGIFIVLTAIGKLLRPGGILHSFFGPTAVVTEKAGVGAVTPAQVAAK